MILDFTRFDPNKIEEYSKDSKKLFEIASYIACLGVNQATKETIIRDYKLSSDCIMKDIALFVCGLFLGAIGALTYTYFQNL